MRPAKAIWVACVLGAVAGSVRTARAEEEEKRGGESRVLRDYMFFYPRLQAIAFPTTHVGLQQGVGSRRVDQIPIDVLGRVDSSQVGAELGAGAVAESDRQRVYTAQLVLTYVW